VAKIKCDKSPYNFYAYKCHIGLIQAFKGQKWGISGPAERDTRAKEFNTRIQ